jgi:hypothetical protein
MGQDHGKQGVSAMITETTIQAVLMRWIMNSKHHRIVLPNSTTLFFWEADVISVANSGFVHEYEIKISRADYNQDAEKHKHNFIGHPQNAPAYFWYVTYGFEIDPPEKAGWILVSKYPERRELIIDVKKNAPRLNEWKLPDYKQISLAHCLSWRLTNEYSKYIRLAEGEDSL